MVSPDAAKLHGLFLLHRWTRITVLLPSASLFRYPVICLGLVYKIISWMRSSLSLAEVNTSTLLPDTASTKKPHWINNDTLLPPHNDPSIPGI